MTTRTLMMTIFCYAIAYGLTLAARPYLFRLFVWLLTVTSGTHADPSTWRCIE